MRNPSSFSVSYIYLSVKTAQFLPFEALRLSHPTHAAAVLRIRENGVKRNESFNFEEQAMMAHHMAGLSHKSAAYVVLTGLKRLAADERPILRWRGISSAKNAFIRAMEHLRQSARRKNLPFQTDVDVIRKILEENSIPIAHQRIAGFLEERGYIDWHIRQISLRKVKDFAPDAAALAKEVFLRQKGGEVILIVTALDGAKQFRLFV